MPTVASNIHESICTCGMDLSPHRAFTHLAPSTPATHAYKLAHTRTCAHVPCACSHIPTPLRPPLRSSKAGPHPLHGQLLPGERAAYPCAGHQHLRLGGSGYVHRGVLGLELVHEPLADADARTVLCRERLLQHLDGIPALLPLQQDRLLRAVDASLMQLLEGLQGVGLTVLLIDPAVLHLVLQIEPAAAVRRFPGLGEAGREAEQLLARRVLQDATGKVVDRLLDRRPLRLRVVHALRDS
mmetsp:Transcript_88871/g.265116  ORF Transcript_88871/g.265116 Transcript_88871/m.265116 type:complete len:241 (+) Transcript_88871:25-747(+)